MKITMLENILAKTQSFFTLFAVLFLVFPQYALGLTLDPNLSMQEECGDSPQWWQFTPREYIEEIFFGHGAAMTIIGITLGVIVVFLVSYLAKRKQRTKKSTASVLGALILMVVLAPLKSSFAICAAPIVNPLVLLILGFFVGVAIGTIIILTMSLVRESKNNFR